MARVDKKKNKYYPLIRARADELQERDRQNSVCPKCGNKGNAEILYGDIYITPGDRLDQLAAAGKVSFGGCIIDGGSRHYQCNNCDYTFGAYTWFSPYWDRAILELEIPIAAKETLLHQRKPPWRFESLDDAQFSVACFAFQIMKKYQVPKILVRDGWKGLKPHDNGDEFYYEFELHNPHQPFGVSVAVRGVNKHPERTSVSVNGALLPWPQALKVAATELGLVPGIR